MTPAEPRMNKDPISNRWRLGTAPVAMDQPAALLAAGRRPAHSCSSDCKVSTLGCAATTKSKLNVLDDKGRLWRADWRHLWGVCAAKSKDVRC